MSEKKSKKEPDLLPRNVSFFTDYDSDTDIRTVEYFVEKYVVKKGCVQFCTLHTNTWTMIHPQNVSFSRVGHGVLLLALQLHAEE